MSKIKPNKPTVAAEDESSEKDWAAAKPFIDNLKITKPRPPNPQNAVTIAISSRVLFNLAEERKIFREQGVEAYMAHEVEHENEPVKPGPAFPLVKALMNVNARLRELYPESEELFDIVLMTSNHAHIGVRLINSINHYDLTIERYCMTGGMSPIGYLKPYMTNLYVSKDPKKVREALEEGIAAATMFMPDTDMSHLSDSELRVAFDGDAVLFSDEHEKTYKNMPPTQGPLKGFLELLGKLQRKFYAKNGRMTCPIRTFLVTTHSGSSSGARVLMTLHSWGLEIDEALFLAGAPKGPLLQKICPHIYFDDEIFHSDGSRKMVTFAADVH